MTTIFDKNKKGRSKPFPMIKPGEFINNLNYFRQSNNLSQAELGRLVGVSRQCILEVEKNKKVPSVKLALNLAKVLETTVEKLFRQEWKAPRNPQEEYLEFLKEEGLFDSLPDCYKL